MVFGFGKKRAVKSSATHLGQRKEIQIDEASTILKEIESPLISKIVEEAKKIKNEIKINQEKIKSTILQLESDSSHLLIHICKTLPLQNVHADFIPTNAHGYIHENTATFKNIKKTKDFRINTSSEEQTMLVNMDAAIQKRKLIN